MDVDNHSTSIERDFKSIVKDEIVNTVSIQGIQESDVRPLIDELTYKRGREHGFNIDECLILSNDIYNAMYKLDVLQKYLDDEDVNEIMVNGYRTIIIERNGQIIYTEDVFESEEILMNVIQSIVSDINRRVNQSNPIVDARLKDGSRIHIVLPPVALNGPILTIRKFKNECYKLHHLVASNQLTTEVSEFLKKLVINKYNIFISGGTSTGKTTFLNALSEHIPNKERVVTIEDAAELSLNNVKNLVVLETKPSNVEGEGAVTMEMLIKASLRMRPDRIIVGEVRGVEALDMLTAMNTGHDGSLSTGHANSSVDMLKRLELMILKGLDLPTTVLVKIISSSIDILIHLERSLAGERYVSEINELCVSEMSYEINPLFVRQNGVLKKHNPLIQSEKMEKYNENNG